MSENKKQQEKNSRSLAVRLNGRFLWRLFGLFVFMDLIIIAFFLLLSIAGANEDARTIIDEEVLTAQAWESPHDILGRYRLERNPLPLGSGSVWLPDFDYQKDAETYLSGTQRISVYFSLVAANNSIYTIDFDYGGESYRFTYQLGNDWYKFIYLFYGLLILEGLMLIFSIGSRAKIIRRGLKPIAEMERAARSINETASLAELNRLAGRINRIDASELDTHLSVSGAQTELKGLALAINNMLDRINEAYRSQVRFVSDASHELRTPISVIQGYANLLDRWGKKDEKTLQESIDAIKGEADHMKEMVEQLLFLARGDNEAMILHPEWFDLNQLAEEVVRESRMIDEAHQLHCQLEGELKIYGDIQMIKQALRILVDNSIKYTPVNERIKIFTGQTEENFFVAVQDNGIGIVPDDLPYIFDRFYRSDESRARKTGGTGLGLSIAKWITDWHGGHMEVLSRKDFGTRITMVLPQKIVDVIPPRDEAENGPVSPQAPSP